METLKNHLLRKISFIEADLEVLKENFNNLEDEDKDQILMILDGITRVIEGFVTLTIIRENTENDN